MRHPTRTASVKTARPGDPLCRWTPAGTARTPSLRPLSQVARPLLLLLRCKTHWEKFMVWDTGRMLLSGVALAASLGFATVASAEEDTIKVGILHSLSGTMAISETTL